MKLVSFLCLAFLSVQITDKILAEALPENTPDVPPGYLFIGCTPSPNECRYSCPNPNFAVTIDANLCSPETDPYNRFACYCKSQSENN